MQKEGTKPKASQASDDDKSSMLGTTIVFMTLVVILIAIIVVLLYFRKREHREPNPLRKQTSNVSVATATVDFEETANPLSNDPGEGCSRDTLSSELSGINKSPYMSASKFIQEYRVDNLRLPFVLSPPNSSLSSTSVSSSEIASSYSGRESRQSLLSEGSLSDNASTILSLNLGNHSASDNEELVEEKVDDVRSANNSCCSTPSPIR